jgi:hypothetical protein
MRAATVLAVLSASLTASNAAAQSRIQVEMINQGGPTVDHEWSVFTGINSAKLAQEGAELLTAATLSFEIQPGDPEQQRAVVTFWSTQGLEIAWGDAPTIRCIDYFDQFMQPTGGACSVPRHMP